MKKLSNRRKVLMIDKSTSMNKDDCPGGLTRWDYAQTLTNQMTTIFEKESGNGIDLIFYAGGAKQFSGITSASLPEIFSKYSPNGTTNTACAVKEVLDQFFILKAKNSASPVGIILLSDKEPDNDALLEIIKDATNKMENQDEISISIYQVGRENSFADFLQDLPAKLINKGAKYPIVETKTWEQLEKIPIEELFMETVS